MSSIAKSLDQQLAKMHTFLENSTTEDEGAGKFIRSVITPESPGQDETYALYFLTDGFDDDSPNLEDYHWGYQDTTGRAHDLLPAALHQLEEVVKIAKERELAVK